MCRVGFPLSLSHSVRPSRAPTEPQLTRARFSPAEKEVESYQLEVQLLRSLIHPGIVAYEESFVTKDRSNLCIVMGYCEGGDLTGFLKKRRGRLLPEKDVLNLFVQMTLALHFMHEKKILHRDLKSQNIFLKGGQVQLGDFGISKVLDSTRGFAQTCIGTPYYMSPEMYQSKKYNYKSDVWALGCVLYEMATLKHAFDAKSLNGLAMKIIRGKYPRLSSTYSTSLHSLVSSMLTIDPKRRPALKKILGMKMLRRRLRVYVGKLLRAATKSNAEAIRHLKAQLTVLGLGSLLEEIQKKQQQRDAKVSAKENAIQKKFSAQKAAIAREQSRTEAMLLRIKKDKERYMKEKERIKEKERLKRGLLKERKRVAAVKKSAPKRRSSPYEIAQRRRLEDARARRQRVVDARKREREARLKRERDIRKRREAERKRAREAAQRARPSSSRPKRSIAQEQARKQRRRQEIEEDLKDHEEDISHLQKARENYENLMRERDARGKASGGASAPVTKPRAKSKPEPASSSDETDEEVLDEEMKAIEVMEENLEEQLFKTKRRLHQIEMTIALNEDAEDGEDEDEDESDAKSSRGSGFHNQTANICFSHESDDSSSDDDDAPSSGRSPVGFRLNWGDRISALRKNVIDLIGDTKFEKAYDFVKRLKADESNRRGTDWIKAQLETILGSSLHGQVAITYNMLDQLHFAESSRRH